MPLRDPLVQGMEDAAASGNPNYVVLRPFRSETRELYRGEIINVSDWRSNAVISMIEHRYITRYIGSTTTDVEVSGEVVRFIDEDHALKVLDRIQAEREVESMGAQEVDLADGASEPEVVEVPAQPRKRGVK